MILEILKEQINDANLRDEKLIILVGRPGSGKSRILRALSHNNYFDVNKELSAKLLPLPREKRSAQVPGLLQELFDSREEPVIILDNIEILFLPELDMDPLKVLARLSRDKTLVVAWVGEYDGSLLSWSEPGRPGYRTYNMGEWDLPIVSLEE